ncbi:MAG: hypothetical protein QOC96_598 [Acidobacteriota bacterium]|nr:hypothetical protein [Acidobacteriota bacterium]
MSLSQVRSGYTPTVSGRISERWLTESASRLAYAIMVAALTLTVFEGAIRKWLIGSDTTLLSYFVYFSKDIAFISLLLLPSKKNFASLMKEFRRWLLPGCALLVAGAIGSSIEGMNPVGALLTLRSTILLPVIAYLALRKIGGVSLRSVAVLLTVFTFVNFALGVYQNSLPADSVLNRYASSTTEITVLETGVRATGTFAYIAGMGIISLVGIWAGMVLLSLGGNRWNRIAGWIALASGFGCGLAAVSRSPILLGAVMILAWGLFFRMGFVSAMRILIVGGFLCFVAVSLNLVPTFTDLGQAVIERQNKGDDAFEDRAFGQFGEAYDAITLAPFGNGLGSEQVAGNYYSTGTTSFTTFETQLPRIIMETGILGLIGFLIICIGAIATLQFAKQNVATQSERSVLLATQLFLISMFYTNVIFNHTASAFTWLIFVTALAGCNKSFSISNSTVNAELATHPLLASSKLKRTPYIG